MGEDDERHPAQRRVRLCLAHLGRADLEAEPLDRRVALEPGRRGGVEHRGRVLLGRQKLLGGGGEVLVLGVDRDEPGDASGPGGGVEAHDHAAERVAGQHVGAGDPSRGKQPAQIADDVGGAARHRDRVAAAQLLRARVGARAVVGADAGEARDRRQHGLAGSGWRRAPDVGAIAGAGLEHDGRAPRAAALQVEPAPAGDRDAGREVALRGGGGDRRRARPAVRRRIGLDERGPGQARGERRHEPRPPTGCDGAHRRLASLASPPHRPGGLDREHRIPGGRCCANRAVADESPRRPVGLRAPLLSDAPGAQADSGRPGPT